MNHVSLTIGDVKEEDLFNNKVEHRVHEEDAQPGSPHIVLDVDKLTSSSSVLHHRSLSSSTVPNDPSLSSTVISESIEFVRKSCRFLLLEQSLRRRRRTCVIMELLVYKLMTVSGFQRAALFLRFLQMKIMSFRRRLQAWFLLEILIFKKKKESGQRDVLRGLQNKILVSKTDLIIIAYVSRLRAMPSLEEATIESPIPAIEEMGETETTEENQEMGETEENQEMGETEENQEMEDIEETKITEENQEMGETEENQEMGDIEETKTTEENQEIGKIGEIPKVKENKTVEEDQPSKLSNWWGNTRNIMAMVAIFFATLAITASFTPPAGVLEAEVAGPIFVMAIHISLITSMSTLFLLFGATATNTKIEKRILQISNLGLWVSLLTLTIAYISSTWVLIPHTWLRIIVTLSTTVGVILLFSCFYSKQVRTALPGSRILQETDTDMPYVLCEIFSGQETIQS